jgi:3-deoxy-D-manno-octulosonic-acid transferase
MIDTIFVIDDYDEINYKTVLKNKSTKIIKIGDSKFERVFQAAKNIKEQKIFPDDIVRDKKLFVIGSSWKEDEDIILPAVNKNLEFDKSSLTILVPHEPKETKIQAIEDNIKTNYPNIKTIRYSRLEVYTDENLIIVDRMGILSRLYSLAYLSYVGGGFKTGLHNILEPAIFNMPVLFSNDVKNSDEDEILLKAGCGVLIENTKQFYRIFRTILNNSNLRNELGSKCELVFKDNLNVAEKIIRLST